MESTPVGGGRGEAWASPSGRDDPADDNGVAKLDFTGSGERIVTAVRVRPMSIRELKDRSRPIILVDEDEGKSSEVVLLDPTFFSRKRDYERSFYERVFRYDHNFLPESTQEEVFDAIGKPLLRHSFDGYNSSLVVYGQTGSGKTYTMIGDQGDTSGSAVPGADAVEEEESLEGIVPRLTKALLKEAHLRHDEATGEHAEVKEKPITSAGNLILVEAKVLATFYEIYNEKVYDLLTEDHHEPRRIREHPEMGAYVEGLSRFQVKSFKDAEGLLEVGLENRQVAETRMNKLSSRSHAVFTLYLVQKLQDPKHASASGRLKQRKDIYMERHSKITLVDLAGSERVSMTGATGERLVEANNINKSLSTLSDVIKALSDKGLAAARERERELRHSHEEDPLNATSDSLKSLVNSAHKHESIFVPYRNSALTWLLKDCLGGNARTVILASISPSEASYNETMSTLRYVERAKLIVNTVRVNETSTDPAFVAHLQKTIVHLQEKVLTLSKAQNIRDAEIKFHLDQQHKELERGFIGRTIEMQEEMHRYKQLVEMGGGSPSKENGVDGESKSHQISLLNEEVKRLTDLLARKEAIIEEYEARLLPALASGIKSSGGNGSGSSTKGVTFATPLRADDGKGTASPSDNPTQGLTPVIEGEGLTMARMKGLVVSYKREKDLLQQQYSALLLKTRDMGVYVESTRDQVSKLDVHKNTLQADLNLSRADRNRLKSELATLTEDCNTYKSEVDFYRLRVDQNAMETKRKLALMELHISRLKEAEADLRHEKEVEMDKFTDLMMQMQGEESKWEAKMKAQEEDMNAKRKELEDVHDAAVEEVTRLKRELYHVNTDLKDTQSKLLADRALVERLETIRATHEEHISHVEEYLNDIQHHGLRYVEGLTVEERSKHEQAMEDSIRVTANALQQSRSSSKKTRPSQGYVRKKEIESSGTGGESATAPRLQAEEDKHEAEILEKENRVLQHKKQMDLLKLSHNRTFEELQDTRNDLQSLESKYKDSEAEVERVKGEKEKVSVEMERGWKHIDHLKCLLEGQGHQSALNRANDAEKSVMTMFALAKSEEELSKIHKNLVLKMNRIEELEAEVMALQEEEKKRKTDEESYAATIKTLRDDVSRSEAHARAVEGESLSRGRGLFGQLDQLNREIKANEARHAETVRGHEEKFAAMATQLTQVKADLAKARLELDRDEHLLQDRQAEHDHDVHEIHKVKAKLSSAEATIIDKNKEIAELEDQTATWERKCNDTVSKLVAKEKEAEELDSFLSATKEQVSEYEGDLRARTAEMKAVEERLTRNLDKTKAESEAALAKSHEERMSLLTKAKADHDAAIARSHDERGALIREKEEEKATLLAQAQAEQAAHEKKLADKHKQLEMRKEAIQAMNDRLATTETQLEESRAVVRTLSDKLDRKEQEHAELQQEHMKTQHSLAEMTKTAGSAESVMAKLNKKITSLQHELDDADNTIKRLVTKNEEEKEEIEYLKGGGANAMAGILKHELEDAQLLLAEEKAKEEKLAADLKKEHQHEQELERALKQEQEKEDILVGVAEQLEEENEVLEKALAKEKEHERDLEEKLRRELEHEKELVEALDRERAHEAELEKALKKEVEHERELEVALQREKEKEAAMATQVDDLTKRLAAADEREKALQAQLDLAGRAVTREEKKSKKGQEIMEALKEDDPVKDLAEVKVHLPTYVRQHANEQRAVRESMYGTLEDNGHEVEILEFARKMEDAEKEIMDLHEQLATAKEEVASLKSPDGADRENFAQKVVVEELRTKLEAAESQLPLLEDRVQDLTAQRDVAQRDLEAAKLELSALKNSAGDVDMVTEVYKNEVSALQERVHNLNEELKKEREKVAQIAQAADTDTGVVVSVTKPAQASANLQHDLESITTQLIEAKMSLAQETHERHDLETQLQQSVGQTRELEATIAELRLKVGSLSTQIKANEIMTKK